MTPKNTDTDGALDDDSLGVLDDTASLDTTAIGIAEGIAQVSVAMPKDDDDDLVDDAVVEGEILSDLVVDEKPLAPSEIGRIHADEIVIELPADAIVAPVLDEGAERAAAEGSTQSVAADAAAKDGASKQNPGEPVTAEVVPDAAEAAPSRARANAGQQPEQGSTSDATAMPEQKAKPATSGKPAKSAKKATANKTGAKKAGAAKPEMPKSEAAESDVLKAHAVPADAAKSEAATSERGAREDASQEKSAAPAAAAKKSRPTATGADEAVRPKAPSNVVAASSADLAASIAAARAQLEKENSIVETPNTKAMANRAGVEPARVAQSEVALTSKRLDDLGDADRETADLLTADRLLDPHRVHKPEPEGAWSHFLYTISGRRINIGDSKRARARKELTAKIAAPLVGGARFVPVLSRKGGVGKTTITTLLGMALADAREDRVIAVDANPDRGTLADRIVRSNHSKSVRDLVRIHDEVRGYHDISAIVARDTTRLDVLASDSDPRVAEAFSDSDYRNVAEVAAHYYSLVLTDTGTGIVHSVMSATLDAADQIVIVAGLSVDEARLASETLTWLETNGFAAQAREAIVVLNQATAGTPLVRLNELEAHFATRAKHVVRMPYDSQIAGGGAIVFSNLQAETRQAARELAALLVEGLRVRAA